MFLIPNATFRERLFRSLRLNSGSWSQSGDSDVLVDFAEPERVPPPKVLVVIAHPDDEMRDYTKALKLLKCVFGIRRSCSGGLSQRIRYHLLFPIAGLRPSRHTRIQYL
jgi:hypothetical protein